MRLARGPFWLGSISKLTRSPPASESKLTLESRPVLWKKYSFPSSAAMKPNPRSETSFLMVPVGIDNLLFSKVKSQNARVLSRRSERGEHRPTTGDRLTLPVKPLGGQQGDSDKSRRGAGELDAGVPALTQLPHAPDRN